MIINASVIINAEIHKVWDTFTDLTCWKSWNTVITDVSGEKLKELAEGGRFNFCIRPFILPLRLETEVEQAVLGKRIVWSAKKFGVFAKHEFFFEELHRWGEGYEYRNLYRIQIGSGVFYIGQGEASQPDVNDAR
jgi:hypothetical protein